ncbi:hypothetical protein NPX79_03775 [Spiroplasma endosymbiont of Anurida maritima]|uniref:hypothetical protein n=1 Tax=Spiroplasma endosymbiont of Anurida maritima TaxID=2967972 RepID=UPI0036D331DB
MSITILKIKPIKRNQECKKHILYQDDNANFFTPDFLNKKAVKNDHSYNCLELCLDDNTQNVYDELETKLKIYNKREV